MLELEELIKRVRKFEEERKRFGRKIRDVNEKLPVKLFLKVKERKIGSRKIVGVDGGLVKTSSYSMDIMLLRGIGVFYSFVKGKLRKVDYHPSSLPTPIPFLIFDPFSEIEFEMYSQIERQTLEVRVARECIEKFEPDVLLMHGSIVPHWVEENSNPVLSTTFKRMIESYVKLYESAEKREVCLAGIIEDSRGYRFCEVIAESNIFATSEIKLLLAGSRDVTLLYHVLQKGERTRVFPYSKNPEKNPMLSKLGKYGKKIFTFYVKTVDFDKPIRVDFLSSKDTSSIADEISSVLLNLSGHSRYGIPSILIEADQRVRLSEKELRDFYENLFSRAGFLPSFLLKRRETRPW